MKKLLIILTLLIGFTEITINVNAQIQQHGVLYGLDVEDTGLKADLVSVWEFNEIVGTIANDAHGSNNGANTGAVVAQTGILDKSYEFDGSTTDNIAITPALFNGLSSFSISIWVYATSTGSSRSRGFVTAWEAAGKREVLFRQNLTNVQFFTFTNAQVGGTISTITLDNWVHYVATYDGSIMKVYKNNSLSGTDFSQTGNIGETTPVSPRIGNYWTETVETDSFDGKIDQTAIWNRALTADEVSELYNSGNGLAYTNW